MDVTRIYRLRDETNQTITMYGHYFDPEWTKQNVKTVCNIKMWTLGVSLY